MVKQQKLLIAHGHFGPNYLSARTGFVFAGKFATFTVYLRHADSPETHLNTNDPKDCVVYKVFDKYMFVVFKLQKTQVLHF